MSQIEIIQLPPDQWQRYRAIRLEALREEPQAFGSTFADMEQKPPAYWQGRLADAAPGEKSWLLFAQEGELLVGIIGAFLNQEQDAVDIVSVYVSRAARGKGAGKALMEGILAAVHQKEGVRKATLGVNQCQTAAIALYRRFGFQVIGEEEDMAGDGQLHRAYLMEKRLA